MPFLLKAFSIYIQLQVITVLPQLPSTGILGSIVKGFKGMKMTPTIDLCTSRESYCAHLEEIFLKHPFSDSSSRALKNTEEVEELTIGSTLNKSHDLDSHFLLILSVAVNFLFEIDDIVIDEEPPPASTSSEEVKGKGMTKLNPILLKKYFKSCLYS